MPVEWPFDALGTRLLDEFGNPGIAVWSCFLAAAKRSPLEGTISFTTEEEAWSQLGLEPPQFTLDEFLKVTGAMKETRRRRRGRITDVTLTRWEELQQTLKRQLARERKARSRAENARDKGVTDRDPDRDRDKDPDPDPGGGLAIAIKEAHKDKANGSEIGSPKAVGEYRYRQDPERYDSLANGTYRPSEATTDPSPKRNDPDTCRHFARTSDGDCAACGTENVSMPEPARHPYESTV
jgi:hypothetical protein